jgi:hypothetical protein
MRFIVIIKRYLSFKASLLKFLPFFRLKLEMFAKRLAFETTPYAFISFAGISKKSLEWRCRSLSCRVPPSIAYALATHPGNNSYKHA